MPERLLEADLFTVKTSIWNKPNTNETSVNSDEMTTPEPTTSDQLPAKGDWKAWGELLKSRLAKNSSLSSETQEPEFEIELKFFKTFFEANWNEACAKQLILIGDPLKKILKKIGFDPTTNPVLAFLLLPFVNQGLLQTKLLNVNSFKAIYNAFAKKMVAYSQFEKENTYNIIYCPDLYKKPAKEIEEYLMLQKRVLSPTASVYKADDQIRNRKIFFELFAEPDMNNLIKALSDIDSTKVPIAKNATLNGIERAKALAERLGVIKATNEVNLNNKEMSALITKLDTVDKKLAAILALSMSTDSKEAKQAVLSGKFKDVDMHKLVAGAVQIASSISKGKLAEKDADTLVKALLSTI